MLTFYVARLFGILALWLTYGSKRVLFKLVVAATVAAVVVSISRRNRKITISNYSSAKLSSQAGKDVPPKSIAKKNSDPLWITGYDLSMSMSSASNSI